ncbi:MAG: TetR/AcrR family transcriptional regulator [Anaerolineae bacterium]
MTTDQEIRQAAVKIFREKGYHGTSMQDIADAVGLLKGSLYHHISGKQDLLMAVYENGMAAIIKPMEEIAASDLPPTAKLEKAITFHVCSIAEHLDEAAVFIHEERSLSPELRHRFVADRDEFERLFRGMIQEGIDAGQFRAVDVPLTTNAILGITNWLAQWYDEQGRLSAEEIAAIFVDFVIRGLQVEATTE